MNESANFILFPLLRAAVCGGLLTEGEKELCTEVAISAVVQMAKKHDVAHLAVYGLDRNGLITDCNKDLGQEIVKAMYRAGRLTHALQTVCKALEAAKIPFMPLKGSVLRQYYPELWMRTSVDADILVHQEDVDRAAEYLVENCGFTYQRKGSHDVILWTQSKLCVELHYRLLPEGHEGTYAQILETVWDKTFCHSDREYWHEMCDEMFYFYHIAHMANHFSGGGCGIRPFLDLWFLDRLPAADTEKRNALLEQGGLLQFANAARQLSRVWFQGEAHTSITEQMESFVIRGGTFGTLDNRVAVMQLKKGGKLRYLFSRIFLPYDVLKFEYPCLLKHKWLAPFFQVVRWMRLLLPGKGKKALYELKRSNGVTEEQIRTTEVFLRDLGL